MHVKRTMKALKNKNFIAKDSKIDILSMVKGQIVWQRPAEKVIVAISIWQESKPHIHDDSRRQAYEKDPHRKGHNLPKICWFD